MPEKKEEEKKPVYKKPMVWLVGVSTFILLSFATLITGGVTLFQLYVWMPDQAYNSVIDGEWQRVNPRLLAFKTGDDFSKAEHQLTQQLKSGKKDRIIAQYLLGSLSEYREEDDRAIGYYQKALSEIDDSWYEDIIYKYFREDIHASLALIYYKNKKNTEALAELKQMEDMDMHAYSYLLEAMQAMLEEPDRADYHFTLGKELAHVLKLKQGRAEMLKAEQMSTDPDLKLRIHNYMKTKMPRQDRDLAPMARYYTLAGDAYEYDDDHKDLKKAAYYYERAINQAPDFELAYHQLSSVYHEDLQYGKAIDYARKAVDLNPNFYLAYLTMGDIELDRENYKAAAQNFNQAQAIVSTLRDQYHTDLSANIENQLGFTYESLEQAREASAHYQKALRMAADDSDDKKYAAEALERLKDGI